MGTRIQHQNPLSNTTSFGFRLTPPQPALLVSAAASVSPAWQHFRCYRRYDVHTVLSSSLTCTVSGPAVPSVLVPCLVVTCCGSLFSLSTVCSWHIGSRPALTADGILAQYRQEWTCWTVSSYAREHADKLTRYFEIVAK
jgi:hypothetical protein